MNNSTTGSICDSGNLRSLDDAISMITKNIDIPGGVEYSKLKSAINRILADDIHSPIDVPPCCNSAMDGYALNSDDIPGSGVKKLKITGVSSAGTPLGSSIQRGQCARIMTGAVLPDGSDTVVMQEDVTVENDVIEISSTINKGDNTRLPGEDIKYGQIILRAGQRLGPAELGTLASVGVSNVPVKPQIRVGYFSTGDELVSLGTRPMPGEIYDSNRYILHGLLARLGVDAVDYGVIKDDPDVLTTVLSDVTKRVDAIITTGGASVGDKDYLHRVLEEIGEVNFWKIAVKPGKPMIFGRINRCHYFGLPGNPVSVIVAFEKLVLPALRRLTGERVSDQRLHFRATLQSNIKKSPGRLEFQRGWLHQDQKGILRVTPFDNQGSHILRSMVESNCFIVLPAHSGNLDAGDLVDVELFGRLIR